MKMLFDDQKSLHKFVIISKVNFYNFYTLFDFNGIMSMFTNDSKLKNFTLDFPRKMTANLNRFEVSC